MKSQEKERVSFCIESSLPPLDVLINNILFKKIRPELDEQLRGLAIERERLSDDVEMITILYFNDPIRCENRYLHSDAIIFAARAGNKYACNVICKNAEKIFDM